MLPTRPSLARIGPIWADIESRFEFARSPAPVSRSVVIAPVAAAASGVSNLPCIYLISTDLRPFLCMMRPILLTLLASLDPLLNLRRLRVVLVRPLRRTLSLDFLNFAMPALSPR